jgi:hypothetical protein
MSGIYCQIGRHQSRSRKRKTKTSSTYHPHHKTNQTFTKSPSPFCSIHFHRRRRSPQPPSLPNPSSPPLRLVLCPHPTNLIYISNPSLRPSLPLPPPILHSTPRLISRRLLPPHIIIRPRPDCRIVKTGRPRKSQISTRLDGPKSPRNNRHGR